MDCAICLAPPENPETVPCCMKIFCSECLKTWVELRSRCPLCVSPLGQIQKNELSHNTSNQFDNGSLMLQTELAAIIQKAKYLRRLYNSKSDVSSSKTHIRKSNLAYVGEQMQSVDQFIEIVESAIDQDDRVTATGMMQRITEMLTEVQLILKGQQTVCFQDYGYSSEQEDAYDYDQQQQIYQKNEKIKFKNGRTNNKKKQRAI